MTFADRQMTIRPPYPCCKGEARLKIIVDYTGIQRFYRKCSRCGTAWIITRKEIRTGQVQMDRLEWEKESFQLDQDVATIKAMR